MRFIHIATLLATFLIGATGINAQEQPTDTLPYFEIGAYPEDYGPGSMLSRYLDGLGYRYYWTTEDLRTEDLAYRPTPEATSSFETLEHIHFLSIMILNVARNTPTVLGEKEELDFEGLRAATLFNIEQASEHFRGKNEEQMAELMIKFRREDKVSEMDFWLAINGPMSDALYHVGQLVSFRRTTGNPLHPGVSVFRGKTSL